MVKSFRSHLQAQVSIRMQVARLSITLRIPPVGSFQNRSVKNAESPESRELSRDRDFVATPSGDSSNSVMESSHIKVMTSSGENIQDVLARTLSPSVASRPLPGSAAGHVMKTRSDVIASDQATIGSSHDNSIDSSVDSSPIHRASSSKLSRPDFNVLPPSLPKQSPKIGKSASHRDRPTTPVNQNNTARASTLPSRNGSKAETSGLVSSLPHGGSGPNVVTGSSGKQILVPPPVGSKAVLPAQMIPTRNSLHHVQSQPKTEPDNDNQAPVSKETVINLSQALSETLQQLNTRANKHASNFVHLSDQVNSFFHSCHGYVESLPPHGKFKFREFLNSLQSIAENLKTCSSANIGEYDKILGNLQKAIQDIDSALKNINIQKITDKV